MSARFSVIPSSSLPQETGCVEGRRSANFHPSIWGDYFLKYASDSNSMRSHGIAEERIERLKGEVGKMLTSAMYKPAEKLNLIDLIQGLGIAYHFELEIDKELEQIRKGYFEYHCDDNDNDLDTVALLFRLLRQRGYHVSCEIFNKFKDGDGNFGKSLIADVQGLLSLFEACHLRYHGDDNLEAALAFTTTHLELVDKRKASLHLEKKISHTLNQPIHKGMSRLEARRYIPLYQEEPSHNEVLLSLAKLDFNLVQEQHRKELGNLTRWWKGLDVQRKFPFTRDRLVELYVWWLGEYYEPEHEAAREILTKLSSVISIIDDIYDVYGTWEELELFTEAIERWDVDAKDGLPEYMQECYKIVLDLYDEIGYEFSQKGHSYRLFYAKEVMKNQVRAYFVEAKWFHQKHVPTMEEYMSIALPSSGVASILAWSFLGMGDIVTKDVFDWLLFNDPKMVKASSVIGRLLDDIAGHKFEQERGHVASAVEGFMEQYRVTEEEAKEELRKQVTNAWKDINEELRRPTVIPMPILMRILNLTQAMHMMYNGETDNYTHAGTKMKEHATSLLVNPLPM